MPFSCKGGDNFAEDGGWGSNRCSKSIHELESHRREPGSRIDHVALYTTASGCSPLVEISPVSGFSQISGNTSVVIYEMTRITETSRHPGDKPTALDETFRLHTAELTGKKFAKHTNPEILPPSNLIMPWDGGTEVSDVTNPSRAAHGQGARCF